MAHYKISDVAEEVKDRENNPSESKYDRFVGLEHYVSGDVEITHFGSTERLESAMKVFKAGDILIARRNVYLKRASTVSFDGLTSGDSIVLRAKDPTIARILPFVLNTDDFWDYADQYSDGTMSKRLSPKLLLAYEFDLPDDGLEDFADLLWAANETRNSYRELLRQTDELVKSQFIEMFGNGVDNPNKWEEGLLGEVCDVRDGTHDTPKYYDEGFPLVTSKNVTDGYINFTDCNLISENDYKKISERSGVSVGDILMPMIGTVGKPVIVEDDREFAIKNVLLIKFREGTKVINKYILALLQSSYFDDMVLSNLKGGNQKFVSLKDMRGLHVLVPPIELQEKFDDFMRQSDKSKYVAFQETDFIENLLKYTNNHYFRRKNYVH